MSRWIALAILLARAVAHAQPSLTPPVEPVVEPVAEPAPAAVTPPDHYARLDFMLGGVAASGITAMFGLSGGLRLGRGSWWLHAELAYGAGTDLDSGGGPVTQVRVGLERAACSDDGVVCLRAGADLGWQHDAYKAIDDPDPPDIESVSALVLVPHLRADLGGDTVRFGVGFELDEAIVGTHHTTYPPGDERISKLIGGQVTAGFAVQW